MRTQYPQNNLEALKNALSKHIKQSDLLINLLKDAYTGALKVKDHKNVTKRLEKACPCHTYLHSDGFSQRVTFYLPQDSKIWKHSDPDRHGVRGCEYFDSTDETVYFATYPELLENIKKRIEGLETHRAQLRKELSRAASIHKKALALAESWNGFSDSVSYVSKEALSLK